jgi:hypothetical protein
MSIRLSNKRWQNVGFPGVLTVYDGDMRRLDSLRVGEIDLPHLAAMKAEGVHPDDLSKHSLKVGGTRLFDRTVAVVRDDGKIVANYRLVFDQKYLALVRSALL